VHGSLGPVAEPRQRAGRGRSGGAANVIDLPAGQHDLVPIGEHQGQQLSGWLIGDSSRNDARQVSARRGRVIACWQSGL
jgi:hypothetical protein